MNTNFNFLKEEFPKIYDQRRRDVLPKHGIKLIEIDYTDFEYDRKNRIIRNEEWDLMIVMKLLRMNS